MTTIEQRDALVINAFLQGTSIPLIVMQTGMTAAEVEWLLRHKLTELSKK
jgi:hypothetical protein